MKTKISEDKDLSYLHPIASSFLNAGGFKKDESKNRQKDECGFLEYSFPKKIKKNPIGRT